MPFWSSQTLTNRLPALITPFDGNAVDCNAYTLHVGPEIYVTPNLEVRAPNSHTKQQIKEGEAFAIPPGQFAFLLTEESIEVPQEAMAFISIKAKVKFRGLVNVSGFHVDPGWRGRLVFAVFNAGPSAVHLERGMPLFLIWYANLDFPSQKHKTGAGPNNILPELINNITGELTSLFSLDKRMREENDKLSDRIHTVEKTQTRILVTAAILGAILLSLIGFLLRESIGDWLSTGPHVSPAPIVQGTVRSPPPILPPG